MRKKVVVLLSKDYNSMPGSGRKNIISSYLKDLEDCFDHVETRVLKTFLEVFNPLLVMEFLLVITLNFFTRTKLPLQCLIYKNSYNNKIIKDVVEKKGIDVILLDGIRPFPILKEFKRHETCGYVMDMDDLMSVRYERYSEMNDGLVLGIYGRKLGLFSGLLGKSVTKKLMIKEALYLKRLEIEAASYFDKIVFTSKEEEKYYKNLDFSCEALTCSQVFEQEGKDVFQAKDRERQSLVYGFIGSDRVPQNRTSIEFLVGMFKSDSNGMLLLAGDFESDYSESNDNVRQLGYVDDLDGFYAELDAVIVPTFVIGGVKTKVVEALSRGIPVVGNRNAFSGINLPVGYPLVIAEGDISNFVTQDTEYCLIELEKAKKFIPEINEQFSSKRRKEFLKAVFGC